MVFPRVRRAGSNADAPLLVKLAGAFEAAGWRAVRYNLPYRQARPSGPPFPAQAPLDRAGLAEVVQQMRASVDGKVAVGGHSYGGRQASILATLLAPVFLIWLWVSNVAVLLGAEFDAELERERSIQLGQPADREPFLPLRDTPRGVTEHAEEEHR